MPETAESGNELTRTYILNIKNVDEACELVTSLKIAQEQLSNAIRLTKQLLTSAALSIEEQDHLKNSLSK